MSTFIKIEHRRTYSSITLYEGVTKDVNLDKIVSCRTDQILHGRKFTYNFTV